MQKVAIVTGANQGLGLALVRSLCQQLGEQGVVYLTARDRQRGEAAAQQLQAAGLSPEFQLLDVSDDRFVNDQRLYIRALPFRTASMPLRAPQRYGTPASRCQARPASVPSLRGCRRNSTTVSLRRSDL